MPINLEALGAEEEPKSADDFAKRLAKQLVAGKSREELLTLAGAFVKHQASEEQESLEEPEGMPQTPDELWNYVVKRYGVRIARVSVCSDHDTPFAYICAGFFGWYPNVFGIGPRGGGKSYDQALLHDLNAHWKPGCVAADTPIDCPRDHRRFPLGVPISQIQPGQLTWTFNEDEWIFELKPVVRVWCSRENAPIYKLTLDDGSVIRATADHRFLRRDGRWAELRELGPGDSLMPLYRDWEPYVRIRPDATRGGGMVREFDAVADARWSERKGMHVDHIDERRENSDPENLQLLTPSEHCSKTMKGRNVGRRRSKDQAERWAAMSDEERAQMGAKIGATMRESLVDREITVEQREAYAEGGRKGGSRPKPQIEVTCSCGKKFWRVTGGHGRHLCPDCKTEARTCPICSETYVVPRKSRKRTCSRSCGQILRHQERAGIFNHKVVSIEPDGSEDVWDMEVADNHNFVTAGVVLHNCESATFGAVEGQAKRVYAAFKTFTDPEEIAGKSLMSETNYKPVGDMTYGSKVEILGGTVAAVNSPHPQYPHSDEVEIMRADTWKESRNLAADKVTPDGRRIRGQNMATSTMKWKGGRVWQTLQKFLEAKKKAIERYGDAPEYKELVDDMITKTAPFYVLTWCLFEVAEQVPNCRSAPENAHLPEWEPGLDRARCKCDCNEIVNGTLESKDADGNAMPRTLESECRGRFYRSRGHRSRGEVVQLFMQNDERTWKAQQLCRETETEGLYIPSFSRARHGLTRFSLDPSNGPIYTGTDWGDTDEAAVVWVQYLERPVQALGYDGRIKILPRGARVAFAEITIAQKTATELGQMAIVREVKLANTLSIKRIPVRKRWADLQGAGDRRDWSKLGLKTARYSTRIFEEHVKEWRGLVDADRFFVVVDEDQFTGQGCPFLCEQLEGWRADENGKESRELPQHVVSGGRYVIYGMHDVYMDSGAQSPEQTEARKMSQGAASAPAAVAYTGPSAYGDRELMQAESDWRARV